MENNGEPLKIRVRGEDGYRVTTIRIREDVIQRLEQLSNETHRSRNEIMHTMLEYGVNHIIVEDLSNQEKK